MPPVAFSTPTATSSRARRRSRTQDRQRRGGAAHRQARPALPGTRQTALSDINLIRSTSGNLAPGAAFTGQADFIAELLYNRSAGRREMGVANLGGFPREG